MLIPLRPDLWLDQDDLIRRGLAVQGSIVRDEYPYLHPWWGVIKVPCLRFELKDGYVLVPGDEEVSMLRPDGYWNTDWIASATTKVLDPAGDEVVACVFHKQGGAFVLRFFELPHPVSGFRDELLS